MLGNAKAIFRGVIVLAGLAVLIGGFAIVALAVRGGLAGRASISQTSTSSPQSDFGPLPVAVGKFAGTIRDLAYSAERNSIFLATLGATSQGTLYEVAASSGQLIETWDLPATGRGGGILSRTKIDEVGAVWISDDYALLRFDPQTQRTAIVKFDLQVAGALPEAFDPGDPMPGTWVSAFGFFGPDVLVARNHVPYLSVLNSALEQVGTIPVPASYAGAWDVLGLTDGTIALAAGRGPASPQDIGVVDPDGNLVRTVAVAASRVVSTDPIHLVSTGGIQAGAIASDDNTVPMMPAPGPMGIEARAAADSSGGVVIYSDFAGTITYYKPVGSSYAAGQQLVLPSHPAGPPSIPLDPLRYPAQPVEPAASLPPVVDWVSALAIDAEGTTWYFDAADGTLCRVMLR